MRFSDFLLKKIAIYTSSKYLKLSKDAWSFSRICECKAHFIQWEWKWAALGWFWNCLLWPIKFCLINFSIRGVYQCCARAQSSFPLMRSMAALGKYYICVKWPFIYCLFKFSTRGAHQCLYNLAFSVSIWRIWVWWMDLKMNPTLDSKHTYSYKIILSLSLSNWQYIYGLWPHWCTPLVANN